MHSLTKLPARRCAAIRRARVLPALAVAGALLVACGGGGAPPAGPPAAAPERPAPLRVPVGWERRDARGGLALAGPALAGPAGRRSA